MVVLLAEKNTHPLKKTYLKGVCVRVCSLLGWKKSAAGIHVRSHIEMEEEPNR